MPWRATGSPTIRRTLAFRNYLGEQALRTGDYKAAAAQYQAIVEQQPDNAHRAQQPRVDARASWAIRRRSATPSAPSRSRPRARPCSTRSASCWSPRAIRPRALEHIAKAVQLAPNRHDIRLNYAKALLKAGRKDDARKELTQLQGVTQDFPGKSEVADLLKQ